MAKPALTEYRLAGRHADGRPCDSARRDAAGATEEGRPDPFDPSNLPDSKNSLDPRFGQAVSDVLAASEKIMAKGVAYIRRIMRGEIVILSMLSQSDGYMSAECLAESTVLSRPRITQALNSLAERGYVEKQRNAHDKRRVNVRLTQAGAEACARLRDELERLAERHLSCLEPDELDAFVRVLQKLGAWNADLDGAPAPTDFLELD